MAALKGASPHHQPCEQAQTGFVFICPGRHEYNRGYPCAAGTGANLNRVLAVLHQSAPQWFQSPSRAAYVITNSWPKVEYLASTGRSVPDVSEVLEDANLARLASEVQHLSQVIACGKQAQAAVKALVDQGRLRAQVAFGRHLSQRSVNMISGGSDTPSRIQIWCDSILGQLHATPSP
jgi:hypothetical protein